MKVNRLLTNICSNDLKKSVLFYTSLFSFKVNFDSDWFIHLVSEGSEIELGLLSERHEIVPARARGAKAGVYITFVVDNVDEVFRQVKELGYEILQDPEDTFYGQKRMLIVAPEGTICDVSAPTMM